MGSEKPLDFRGTYNINKVVLKLLGIYPGSAATNSVVVYIKRIFGLCMWILFITSMLIFVFINRDDTVKLSKTFFICLTFMCALIKTINFTFNINNFFSMEQLLDNEIFYDETYISMMKKDIGDTQRNVRAYSFFPLTTVMIYLIVTPFLANDDEYRLAWSCYTPWDINNVLNYVLSLLFQCAMTALSTFMNLTIDALFMHFSTIACTELRALKTNLEALDYSPSNSNIKSEIGRNIVLHKQIIKLSDAMENVFSYGILGQFATAIVIICFAGFQLASPISEDDKFGIVTDLSGTFGHLLFIVFQVSIYCIYGHQMMVESWDINEAIYLSNWYKADLNVRKDLIIIRERSKRPIILTAGKLFPLTVDTLVMILRASYSFFAVIRQTN